MKILVEPNDFAPRLLGEELLCGEPFCDLAAPFRRCLRECFEPVAGHPVSAFPHQLRAELELFDKLLPPASLDGGIHEFAAGVLRMIWSRQRMWIPLWSDAQAYHQVVANLVAKVAGHWDAILMRWSNDQTLDFQGFALKVVLPHTPLGELVDWKLCENLLDPGSRTEISRQQTSTEYATQPRHPVFWLLTALGAHEENGWGNTADCGGAGTPPEKVLKDFEPHFRSLVVAGDWRGCQTVLAALQNGLTFSMRDEFGRGWAAYGTALRPWFEAIDAKHPDATGPREAQFLWFRIANRCFSPSYGMSDGADSSQSINRILTVALKQLGQFRTELREKGRTCDLGFYGEALDTVRSCGRWWQAIKPLLLALRELREPAVADDLRYWGETGKEPPPEPLHNFAQWIANLLGNPALREERASEADLRSIRAEFAAYCLNRLKTKDTFDLKRDSKKATDDDFIEPSPIWRACYARAASELRINPRGKSHHIAWWSSQNDPDEVVRESARQLYDRLRHEVALDPELSPRRPLLAAYWWLRQAHLLALGCEIDPAAAQRTRTKELRWGDRFEPDASVPNNAEVTDHNRMTS